MNTAIATRGLVVEHGTFALGPLDLQIPAGLVTGFLGANGSGKTTTLKTLLGLVRPRGGAYEMPPAGQVGVSLDELCLVPDWTLRQAAAAIAGFRPGWDQPYVDAVWERFGLRPDARVKELSRGQGGVLGVSLALGNHPALLLLDEPTSGLDPGARLDLVDLLREHMVADGRTLLFSTHITADLDDFADHLVLIRDGRIVSQGPAAQVREGVALVRGLREDLIGAPAGLLLGARWRGDRFEGLVAVDELGAVPRRCEVAEASLDQLVALLGRTDRGAPRGRTR